MPWDSLMWVNQPEASGTSVKRPASCGNATRRAASFLSRRVSVCHCGSMHGSVYPHMVYSVRAKLAVHITARLRREVQLFHSSPETEPVVRLNRVARAGLTLPIT
jgi:hypothetical protein